MRRRGNLVVWISGAILAVVIAGFINPDFRDRMMRITNDGLSVLRQFGDFVSGLFRST